MYIVDFRCKHCRKWKGEHRAKTFECPTGTKTRIGYCQYGPDVYEPNPKKPKTVPFVLGNHFGEVEVKKKSKDDAADVLNAAVGASIGNALADALNGIANIPAPKKKTPKKFVEDPAQQVLLVIYEMMPEEVFLYFIPQPELLAKNLYGALRAMENITVNCVEMTPTQDKAFQYLNAAMCNKKENLDEQNPFDCNRFAHQLVPFLIDRSETAKPLLNIPEGRSLRIIRSGFAM
jgi:hypothetical protein